MKKILVVDDVPGNRAIFVGLLEDQYTVLEAADGRESIEIAERESPDLIFLDVFIPPINYLDTIPQF